MVRNYVIIMVDPTAAIELTLLPKISVEVKIGIANPRTVSR